MKPCSNLVEALPCKEWSVAARQLTRVDERRKGSQRVQHFLTLTSLDLPLHTIGRHHSAAVLCSGGNKSSAQAPTASCALQPEHTESSADFSVNSARRSSQSYARNMSSLACSAANLSYLDAPMLLSRRPAEDLMAPDPTEALGSPSDMLWKTTCSRPIDSAT